MPEHRWVNAGLDLADSYCTNPHKWMGINFDCDLFWTADRTALLGALTHPARVPALRGRPRPAPSIDYRDWQVPLGRRFRSLKLWFTLRLDGVEPVQAMIRDHVGLTQELAELVAADDRFEIVAPHPLNLLCLAPPRRRRGNRSPDRRRQRHRRRAVHPDRARRPLGRCASRSAARTTERRHVAAAWALLQSTGQNLARSGPTDGRCASSGPSPSTA